MNRASSQKPRGRPLGFDREQALEQAMLLFWNRGYDATSVSDLTQAMGINPPSLYAAFGDKRHLFLEAVDRYQAGQTFAQKALTEEPTAESAMRQLLLGTIDFFFEPNHPKGCMVVLSATNCVVESADVAAEMTRRRKMAERVIRDRIEAGRVAGELPAGTDIDALAGMVATTLNGISIKVRDGASRASLRKIVELAMQSWPRRPKPRR